VPRDRGGMIRHGIRYIGSQINRGREKSWEAMIFASWIFGYVLRSALNK